MISQKRTQTQQNHFFFIKVQSLITQTIIIKVFEKRENRNKYLTQPIQSTTSCNEHLIIEWYS